MQSNKLKYDSINNIPVADYIKLVDNNDVSVLFNHDVEVNDMVAKHIYEKINIEWLNATGGDNESQQLIKKQALAGQLYWSYIASNKSDIGMYQQYLMLKGEIERIVNNKDKKSNKNKERSFRKLTRQMNRLYYTHSEDYSKMILIDFATDYKEFINEQDQALKAKLAKNK